MEKRRSKGTAMIRSVIIMLLFLLALPSWTPAQQVRSPEIKNPKLRERLGLDKPRELESSEIQQQQQAREEEIRREQEEFRKRGIIRQLWAMLTLEDQGPPSAYTHTGVRDTNVGDRPGHGFSHVAPQAPLPDWYVKLEEQRERDEGAREFRDSLRARTAEQRARRELKAAQEMAQAEKQAADARTARAAVEQQSQGCFPRGTRVVMADGTTKSIADVKPGDVVMTYDIGYDEIVGKPVVATYSVKSNHLYTVNNDLRTTGGERLLTQSGWKPLIALTEQDLMHVNGRMTGVDTIDYRRMELKTYNLKVDDTHNFYVQTESGNVYLVHNCGGGGK